MNVQYRVAFGKGEKVVEGPDNADVVISIDAKYTALNPTVAYMLGKLKAEGNTRALFESLWSGEAQAAISRLASRP